ncbi:MFS transporter, SP family, general alpha glucoside:H+ symporter [Kwoniella heveanensis CBS 569]|uniref:MFS transporter, SP family, general alpha glucoside:H+ symporter n=1 Tax=Kwoniella heveanensis BCC8398 TaxID=1296120 RepID=A0A1B9GMY0_9TREE|nr:MFS transporter, SP family, general alpha glucoside:H+ symporter [Kwoniella heveanensis BCC8398]OCF43434.1 MFS transporter, SP family, general alpha glucoside:H+ symporter [Kwoniella heveanensis CBS 569]
MSHNEKVTTDQGVLNHVRGDIDNYDEVVIAARAAAEAEKTMTLRQGIARYPKAVGWSILLSTALVMEGFDIVLIANFYALPQFTQRYGIQLPDGSYTITAAWQAGLSNGGNVGQIIGLAINGWASERFGYRKTMIAALSMMIVAIFIPFFAKNIETLLVGQIFCGIPWGVFQTLTTSYAAEVVPVVLRPYLTAYVNICWVLGQIIASGVLRGVLDMNSQWAYRIPFALQWTYPVPLLIGCLLAPESPWWQVRKGDHDGARRTLRRLVTGSSEEEIENSVSYMIHTNALEKSITAGTSYLDCFRGFDLRRTEVAAGAWIVQNFSGSAFMGYSTLFLQQAGLAVTQSFNMSIAQYGLGLLGTITSWFLMSRFGRRTLYLSGLVGMCAILLTIGGLGFTSRSSSGAQWAIGGLLLAYTAVYDATIGPVCYTIVGEIGSTRLRAKTVAVARIFYVIMGIINAVIMPYFLNTTKLNWGGKTGLFWGGFCAVCLVWAFFRLPEARGRTYGELDVLFENKVSARKFSSTDVDQFAGHSTTPEIAADEVEDKVGSKASVAHLEHS